MLDTLTTSKARLNCHAYKPDLIPETTLQSIIEAGTYAAVCMGKKPPIIIAVTDKAVRDKLSKINAAIIGVDIDPFYGAPELLIVLANRAVSTYVYDGSLVMGNMINAAVNMGVANCWIHRAKEVFESSEGKAILEKCGIKGDYEGIGHLLLGYAVNPAAQPAPKKDGYVYRID